MRDFLKLLALIVALDVWHEGRHAEQFWVKVLASGIGLFVVKEIADSYYAKPECAP
jgi:hypothetical protein